MSARQDRRAAFAFALRDGEAWRCRHGAPALAFNMACRKRLLRLAVDDARGIENGRAWGKARQVDRATARHGRRQRDGGPERAKAAGHGGSVSQAPLVENFGEKLGMECGGLGL